LTTHEPATDRRPLEAVTSEGVTLRAGERVRLQPRGGADAFDLVLRGKTAVVEAIEQDFEGQILLAVSLDDDPGRDLDSPRRPGRRYYFRVEEVVPERGTSSSTSAGRPRVLVAGIGNVFLGDDGFGVEVARRLAARELPAAARVVDFGIRGIDLAFALLDGVEAAVLVDTTRRGGQPGTLYVLELSADDDGDVALEGHDMTPHQVLRWAGTLGGPLPRLYLVGCEPARLEPSDDGEIGLSAPVAAAVDEAVGAVQSLVAQLLVKSPE
jgi:hydrogenase maturation protease